MITPQPFRYRLFQASNRVFPGAHPGQMVSSGQLFKRHEPLIASPDPRRIDLRASVLDPFGGFRVRVYQQQCAVSVYVIADLSASMDFATVPDKRRFIADFAVAAASSAFDSGDSCGFIGCGARIENRWVLPAGRQMGPLQSLAQRLQQASFSGTAASLPQAAQHLSARRSVVFLLSDCHFDLGLLQHTLRTLQGHDVVPVVPWHPDACANLPQWGVIKFRDSESRGSRTLFLRPALRQKILDAFDARRRELQRCFRAFGCEPLFVGDRYNAATFNAYFLRRAACPLTVSI